MRAENCNAVSDLGSRAARPGRYSTDRPERTVLVSNEGSPAGPSDQPQQMGSGLGSRFGRERGTQGGGLTPFAGKGGLPPDQRPMKVSGSICRPSLSTSKCTCGPVERPVVPT